MDDPIKAVHVALPAGWASAFQCDCGCWYAVEPVCDNEGQVSVVVTRMAQPPCRAAGTCA